MKAAFVLLFCSLFSAAESARQESAVEQVKEVGRHSGKNEEKEVERNATATDKTEDTMTNQRVQLRGTVLHNRYRLDEFLSTEQPTDAYGRASPFKASDAAGNAVIESDKFGQQHIQKVEHLATGSFGDVWKGFDMQLGTEVVMKMFYKTTNPKIPLEGTFIMERAGPEKAALDEADHECAFIQSVQDSDLICKCLDKHMGKCSLAPAVHFNGQWVQQLDANGQPLMTCVGAGPFFVVLEMCGADLELRAITSKVNDDGNEEYMNTIKEKLPTGQYYQKPNPNKLPGAEELRTQEPFVRTIMTECLQALVHLQKLNMIHRDLKPGNIALTDKKTVKIIDFGVAIPPQSGRGGGTPGYFPPLEASQIINNGPAWDNRDVTGGFKFDIYSMGMVYMKLLCHTFIASQWNWPESMQPGANQPFTPNHIKMICQCHIPSNCVQGITDEHFAFISALLQENPSDRPDANQALGMMRKVSSGPAVRQIIQTAILPGGRFSQGMHVFYSFHARTFIQGRWINALSRICVELGRPGNAQNGNAQNTHQISFYNRAIFVQESALSCCC